MAAFFPTEGQGERKETILRSYFSIQTNDLQLIMYIFYVSVF